MVVEETLTDQTELALPEQLQALRTTGGSRTAHVRERTPASASWRQLSWQFLSSCDDPCMSTRQSAPFESVAERSLTLGPDTWLQDTRRVARIS